jgi:hypothetical protein
MNKKNRSSFQVFTLVLFTLALAFPALADRSGLSSFHASTANFTSIIAVPHQNLLADGPGPIGTRGTSPQRPHPIIGVPHQNLMADGGGLPPVHGNTTGKPHPRLIG